MEKRHKKNKAKFKAYQFPADTNKMHWKRSDAMAYKEVKENTSKDESNLLIEDKLWQVAELLMPSNVTKKRITIRIDADVLEWLRKQGKGYQSKINSILRTFMKTDLKHRLRGYKHTHQNRHL